jgi:hypothetical protein
MKLKIDDGKVVLKDGLPVYIYDDGTEAAFDAKATLDGLNKRISNVTEEKDRFFKKATDYETKLKPFEQIDPAKYTEYEKIVKNLNDQQLLDQKGIETLKNTMRQTFDEEKKAVERKFQTEIQTEQQTAKKMQDLVYDLVLKNKFANSTEWFGTEKSKTIYPAEDAAMIFGKHFEVEIKDNNVNLIAKDAAGNVIMSKKNHGEAADFDEAISQLVEARAKKYSILRSNGPGGPQIHGNLETSGKSIEELTPQERIRAGLNQRFKGQFGAPR